MGQKEQADQEKPRQRQVSNSPLHSHPFTSQHLALPCNPPPRQSSSEPFKKPSGQPARPPDRQAPCQAGRDATNLPDPALDTPVPLTLPTLHPIREASHASLPVTYPPLRHEKRPHGSLGPYAVHSRPDTLRSLNKPLHSFPLPPPPPLLPHKMPRNASKDAQDALPTIRPSSPHRPQIGQAGQTARSFRNHQTDESIQPDQNGQNGTATRARRPGQSTGGTKGSRRQRSGVMRLGRKGRAKGNQANGQANPRNTHGR